MRLASLLITTQFPAAGGVAVGGLYTHTGELHAGLSRLGCAVEVLTLPVAPRLDTPTSVEGGVHRVRPSDRVLAIPMGADREPTPAHLTLYSEELVAYVCEHVARSGQRPAVLHVHDYFLVPAALEMRKRLGIPVVLSVHMLHAPLRTWWGSPIVPQLAALERMACLEADAVIAVSHSIKDVLCKDLGIDAGKVHVVHNGFDASAFLPAAEHDDGALRAKLALAPGDQVVVYAGRLTRQKGVVPLVRAAAQVVRQAPQAVFALAGTPMNREGQSDERRELLDAIEEILAAHPQLAGRVRPLGDLSRPELAQLYRLSAAAVVPSVYEPFGYAAIEAVVAGAPVIASAVGGLPEIIDHERTGLLVEVDTTTPPHRVSEAGLAHALLRLLRDRELAARLVAAGRQRVLDTFTRERMAEQTLAVYQLVVAR